MKNFVAIFVLAAGFLIGFFHLKSLAQAMPLKTFLEKPKLVVVIVIDQFRADYLTRFEKRFVPSTSKTPGGFRFLMQNGAYYPFAEYEVVQNLTCAGHATILTGAQPNTTGIPGNVIWDAKLGRLVPCTQDEKSTMVGFEPKKKDEGASPARLHTSTFGDELKLAGYSTRVVTIALKERAAIMLGGRTADLALWFEDDVPAWVSSRYYLPSGELPAWVKALNKKVADRPNGEYVWTSSLAPTGLSQPANAQANERTFVRKFSYKDKELISSPYGAEISVDAALEAVTAMKLGHGSHPDVLGISLSSHDLFGHVWGPNSREMEEMTVAEDRILQELFKGLEKRVPGGLKNVLIAFTADHGMAPVAPFTRKLKFDAVEIDEKRILLDANDRLAKKFGKPSSGQWISDLYFLNFFVNPVALAEKKLASSEIEAELKTILIEQPGIAHVFTQTDYRNGTLPPGMHRKQILNAYVPGVSGDVMAIPEPFSYRGTSPTHHTGYGYDRTVPIILVGSKIKAGVYPEAARVIDLAPTLSFLTGIMAPATSEGRVLSEAIRR